MKTQPLIINNWQAGVADSEFLGFGSMKMVDIELFPGSLKCQKKPITLFHTPISIAFTADPSTDICTLVSGSIGSQTGVAVTVSTSNTLPTGLSASTNYFLIPLTSNTFKLATTIANANAGTAIDITGAGVGTQTVTTVNPGTPRHFAKDYRANVLFMQDSNSRVWYLNGSQFLLLNGNTTSSGAGNGLLIFVTTNTLAASAIYLLAFRNANIDIVNVYSTANVENPSWTNSWQALNSGAGSGNSHHAIFGQDLVAYFCDGQFVGSLKENIGATFAPGTGASFTYNNQALDVPPNEICQWLEELGINLLIAGKNFNLIYPWDRLSTSYSLPLAVPERQILKLKNSGGQVYILAGTNGNIYTTQGTYVTLFKKIPGYLVNPSATIQSNPVTWGSIAIRNGAIIIGCSMFGTGNSGVYLLYPDGRLTLDNIPIAGSGNVTALFCETDYYYLGSSAEVSYINDASSRYTDFSSVVETQLYKVGDKSVKASYSTVEIQVAKPGSGSVRVAWRPDTTSAYTTITTFAMDGTSTSFDYDAGLTDLENIQFQISITSTVELLEVRIIP